MNTDNTPRSLRRFTKLVAASTLFLVFAGAMVTSTGSGLAVPDWPLSYGMLMPPMVGGIFYEHGHRMIATTVGLLTLIQAFWLQFREPKRFVRTLGWLALAAVVVQGLLGGLTVLFLLPLPISVSHATLAEVFFCMSVAIAFYTSATFARLRFREGSGTGAAARACTILASVVFLQIVVGALMRHLGAGLAIPDFPLSFGRIVPNEWNAPVAVNFAHRMGGLTVALVAGWAAVRIFRSTADAALRPVHASILAVVAIQIALGAFTIWTGKSPIVTSLHVAIGALTLALALVSALIARTLAGSRRARLTLSGREVTA
jgi:cytochrome c oxidase assembly protein subunit 15